jgi:hypothetical protein
VLVLIIFSQAGKWWLWLGLRGSDSYHHFNSLQNIEEEAEYISTSISD